MNARLAPRQGERPRARHALGFFAEHLGATPRAPVAAATTLSVSLTKICRFSSVNDDVFASDTVLSPRKGLDLVTVTRKNGDMRRTLRCWSRVC